MSHTREYQILKGPYAGKVFKGQQIGARFTPDGPVDWSKTGNRAWIPELQESFLDCSSDPDKENEVQDLQIPYDQEDKRIEVGDVLFVAVGHRVVKAKVLAWGKPHHHGCGWMERQLKLQDIKTGKKFSNNYPHECLKIS
jgi:hypothetical protein